MLLHFMGWSNAKFHENFACALARAHAHTGRAYRLEPIRGQLPKSHRLAQSQCSTDHRLESHGDCSFSPEGVHVVVMHRMGVFKVLDSEIKWM